MVRMTSAAAYRQIRDSGLLSKSRMDVYSVIYKHGPLTSAQAYQFLTKQTPNKAPNQSRARFTELREMGLIKEIGTTHCPITGHTVILWDVTDGIPKEFEKKKKTKIQKAIQKERKECAQIALNMGSRRIGAAILARDNYNLFGE